MKKITLAKKKESVEDEETSSVYSDVEGDFESFESDDNSNYKKNLNTPNRLLHRK